MFCLWNFMLQGPIALSGCSPHASKPCNCPAPRPKKVRGDSQQRESYKSSSKSWSDTPLWTEDSSIHQGQGAVWKGYQLQGELGCREPAWGIQPMAKVMRKEAWHTQRWDQASGVPLDILEYLPLKPESAYLTAVCFHLHFWHYGGLSPTTSLWKWANLELQLINLLGVTRVFQSKNSSDGSLACLRGLSGHMWLFTASQPWEAWDALNFLNTDSFEKLENY